MAQTLFNYVRNLPEDIKRIIGKGPKFPIDTSSGQTATNDGLDRINQSIFIILSTPLGEVWFNPNFGSRLHEYVFHPIDAKLEASLRQEILRALSENEPRITIIDISFDRSQIDQNILNVNITYALNGTNLKEIYVYPFNVEPSGPFV